MRTRCGYGLLGMVLVSFMIMSCAETRRPVPPPAAAQAPEPRPVATQEQPASDMELIRQKVHADKKLLVSMNMELSESEAEKFWPLYDRYQVGLSRFVDRELELIKSFARNYESMTNAVARRLLEDYLALEDDLLAMKQSYLPKFREVLPERKVARYYQIENKIEAIYDLDLAAGIPLLQ